MPDACLMLVKPGHQRGPGRTAASCVVKLRKAQPTGGKPVQIRRMNLTTITADIRISHIVSHNQDDIGPFDSISTQPGSTTAPRQRQCRRPKTHHLQKITARVTMLTHIYFPLIRNNCISFKSFLSIISICYGKRKSTMSPLRKQGVQSEKTGFPLSRE